jgi:hypothetical protein
MFHKDFGHELVCDHIMATVATHLDPILEQAEQIKASFEQKA